MVVPLLAQTVLSSPNNDRAMRPSCPGMTACDFGLATSHEVRFPSATCVETCGARGHEVVHPLGHIEASRSAHASRPACESNRVPAFKGAELPPKSSTQRVVDAVGFVADFRDAVAHVGKDVRENAAVELARLVLTIEQEFGSRSRKSSTFLAAARVANWTFCLGLYSSVLRSKAWISFLPSVDHLLVEALARLAAQPVALVDEVLHVGGNGKHFGTFVVGAVVGHAIGHVHQGCRCLPRRRCGTWRFWAGPWLVRSACPRLRRSTPCLPRCGRGLGWRRHPPGLR